MSLASRFSKYIARIFRRSITKEVSKTSSNILEAGSRWSIRKSSVVKGLKETPLVLHNVVETTSAVVKTSWKKMIALASISGVGGVLFGMWATAGGLRDSIANILGIPENAASILMIVVLLIVVYVLVSRFAVRSRRVM